MATPKNIMEQIEQTSAIIYNNQLGNFPDNNEQIITPEMARNAGNTIAEQENNNILYAHTSKVIWNTYKGYEVQQYKRPSDNVAPMGYDCQDLIKYTGSGNLLLIRLPYNCKFEFGNLADYLSISVFNERVSDFDGTWEPSGDQVVTPLWFYPITRNKKGVQYRVKDGIQTSTQVISGFTDWNDGYTHTYIAVNITEQQTWSPLLFINGQGISEFATNWHNGDAVIQNEHISTIDLFEEEKEIDTRRKSQLYIETLKSSKIVPGSDPDYSTLQYDNDWQTIIIKVPANSTFTMSRGYAQSMDNMVITEVYENTSGLSFLPSFGEIITPAKYYNGTENDLKEYYANGPYNDDDNVTGTTKALENVESQTANYTYILWSTEFSTYQYNTPLPDLYINNQKVFVNAIWSDITEYRKNWYVYKQNSIVDLAVDLSRNFGALNLDSFSKIYSNDRRTMFWGKVMADIVDSQWVLDGDSEVKGFWVNPGERIHIDVNNASLNQKIAVISSSSIPEPNTQIDYAEFVKTGFDYTNNTNGYNTSPSDPFYIIFQNTYSTINFVNTNQDGCWIVWQSKLQGVDLGNPQSIYVNDTNIYQNGSFTGVEVGSTLLNFMQEILYLREQVNELWAASLQP